MAHKGGIRAHGVAHELALVGEGEAKICRGRETHAGIGKRQAQHLAQRGIHVGLPHHRLVHAATAAIHHYQRHIALRGHHAPARGMGKHVGTVGRQPLMVAHYHNSRLRGVGTAAQVVDKLAKGAVGEANGSEIVGHLRRIVALQFNRLQLLGDAERIVPRIGHYLHIPVLALGKHLARAEAGHGLVDKGTVAQPGRAAYHLAPVPRLLHAQRVDAEGRGHARLIPRGRLVARHEPCLVPSESLRDGMIPIVGKAHGIHEIAHRIHAGEHQQLPVDAVAVAHLREHMRSVPHRRVAHKPRKVGSHLLPLEPEPDRPRFQRLAYHHHEIPNPRPRAVGGGISRQKMVMVGHPRFHKGTLAVGNLGVPLHELGRHRARYGIYHGRRCGIVALLTQTPHVRAQTAMSERDSRRHRHNYQ